MEQLQRLNNDISLHSAQATFENSTLTTNNDLNLSNNTTTTTPNTSITNSTTSISSKRLNDPTLIDEEISYFEQYLSKLKFLYLEQETRDKFLRNLLIESEGDKSITDQDLQDINKLNTESKTKLKSLKDEINKHIEKINESSSEVIDLNKSYNQKLNETNQYISEISAMESNLNSILTDIENNEDHLILFNLQKSIINDEKIIDFNKIIEISNNQLLNDINTFEDLNNQIILKHKENEFKLKFINELNIKLSSLINNQNELLTNDSKNDSSQIFAQLIKQLNELLLNFVTDDKDIKIQINKIGANYQLLIKNWNVLLDSNLKILNFLSVDENQVNLKSNLSSYDKVIKDINKPNNELNGFLKLLSFFNTLLSF